MTTAYMMAAGAGSRLDPGRKAPPKVLLRFGGASLLQRHVEILRYFGFRELVMVVGYRAEEIVREVREIGAEDFVRLLPNPHYRDGSLGSLWLLAQEFAADDPSVLMDADVLYDHRLMDRLLRSPYLNCLLLDREVGEDDDPLRVCIREGRIVDFHKRTHAAHDWQGQWIGFIRYGPTAARLQRELIRPYIESRNFGVIYEEPMRDLLIAAPEPFGYEDVSELPWIEIDFPEDLEEAERKVFPLLEALPQ